MLQFSFEFTPDARRRGISDFSLGYITVGQASSTAEAPPSETALMVFPSVVNLLDGAREFLSASETRVNRYTFEAVGSRFALTFTRNKDGSVTVSREKEVLGTATGPEIAQALLHAAQQLVERDGQHAGSVADDLFEAVLELEDAFGS